MEGSISRLSRYNIHTREIMPPGGNGLQSPALSISQRTFSLTSLPGPSASTSASSSSRAGRASRRLHVPAEVLRASKIGASDPILVASTLSARDLGKRLSLKENGQDGKQSNAAKLEQKVSCEPPRPFNDSSS